MLDFAFFAVSTLVLWVLRVRKAALQPSRSEDGGGGYPGGGGSPGGGGNGGLTMPPPTSPPAMMTPVTTLPAGHLLQRRHIQHFVPPESREELLRLLLTISVRALVCFLDHARPLTPSPFSTTSMSRTSRTPSTRKRTHKPSCAST